MEDSKPKHHIADSCNKLYLQRLQTWRLRYGVIQTGMWATESISQSENKTAICYVTGNYNSKGNWSLQILVGTWLIRVFLIYVSQYLSRQKKKKLIDSLKPSLLQILDCERVGKEIQVAR